MNSFKLLTILAVSTIVLSACGHTVQQADTTQTSETEQQDPLTISPQYVEYSDTAVTSATANDGKAVLFFHANWCPTCRTAEKDILSRIDELNPNITVIVTDYDEYQDLKKKYGVTYQHTFVQVNSEGELITIWNGGALNEINKRTK